MSKSLYAVTLVIVGECSILNRSSDPKKKCLLRIPEGVLSREELAQWFTVVKLIYENKKPSTEDMVQRVLWLKIWAAANFTDGALKQYTTFIK